MKEGKLPMRLFCVIALALFCAPSIGAAAEERSTEKMAFEGTVLRIGSASGGVSGVFAVYQLVKYRVKKACSGTYNDKEIVVDHLIVTGKELEGIKVGDSVCVAVEKSKDILARYNRSGIRKASDVVPFYYIGSKVSVPKQTPCGCLGS